MNKNKIVFYNILSTLVLQGLSFLTLPIFSRILGNENFGVVSVYTTWVTLSATVLTLQMHSSLVVARNTYGEEEQVDYQACTIFLSWLIYFSSSILIIIGCLFINNQVDNGISVVMVICILLQGWGTFCVTFLNSKFTYEFKANYNAILTISISLSTIILSLFFLQMIPNSYWGRVIGLVIPYSIVGIITPFILCVKSKRIINRKYAFFAIVISIPIVFHSLANVILGQSDRVMLQYMDSAGNVGIYSLVYSFTSVISIIWGALNNSYAPFYYDYIKKQEAEQILISAKNYIQLFAVLCCGFILLSREVYCLFADKSYWSGLDLIPILVISSFFVFVYSFFVNYEIANRKTRMIAINTVSAAIINILLNLFLIQRFSVIGAAIATLISYFAQCVFHYIYASHIQSDFHLPITAKLFIKSFWSILCCSVLFYCLKDATVVRWFLAITMGIFELSVVIKRKSLF